MAHPAESSSGGGPETTARYVAPFALFLLFLGLQYLNLFPLRVYFALWVVALAAILFFYSRPVIRLKPNRLIPSLLLGVAVFVIWIGPDELFPAWRHHWLFHNVLTGGGNGSLPAALRGDALLLTLRVLRAVAIVPIVEELFWRGWLMRWLIDADFRRVPFGTYAPLSFWVTALMFASEHGPYWDVGLIAGIAYNWWAIRTKSLADCILAHAVTNGVLCVWVIAAGHWEYWL